jgi:molecular chaperone HscA
MEQLHIAPKIFNENKILAQEFRIKAEEAKRKLSSQDIYTGSIGAYSLALSKNDFETLVNPLVTRTLQSCSEALRDAGLKADQIEEIIMVGGTTRIPLVRNRVGDLFGKKVHNELNPDEVVALGAAIQADILAGNNKDFLLLDITPLSLGIETMGGLMDVLIPRNSKIPTRVARQYTTQKDGQAGIRISVYQGERDLVQYNRKLAEFNLRGIPGMPAGFPKVEVSFLINADGILVVKARELRSGAEQIIEVKPQYGLTDEEVENRLLDSIAHAGDDIKLRSLVEAKTEGEQIIGTTEKFIQKNTGYLSQGEIYSTNLAIAALQETILNGDKDSILKKIEELNMISKPYAERLMDLAVSKAMSGKKITE